MLQHINIRVVYQSPSRRGWHGRGKYRDFKARDLEGSLRRALRAEALDRVEDGKFELSEGNAGDGQSPCEERGLCLRIRMKRKLC